MDFSAELVFGKTYELNKHATPAGDWIVEGYASTSDIDSQNHIVSPDAIKMGADSLTKYNTVLFNHDPDRPIGKIKMAEAQDTKLFMKVAISKTEPKLWEQIKDGTLSKFSIMGKILDSEYYEDPRTYKQILLIKGMELHEVSLVSVPANPEAKSLSWYIEKALKEKSDKEKLTEEALDAIEKKTYRKPNESMSDCVSRKTKANMAEGMPQKQAVAAAYSMCGEAKKSDSINLEEIVISALDVYEEISKANKNNFELAITNLETGLTELKGDDKDQVESMIRTLKALIGRVYRKSLDEDKGGLPEIMETKEETKTEEVKKTDEVKTEETVKKTEEVKTEEVKKEATVDVSALTAVITQLQSMVKDANTSVENVSKSVAEVAKVKDEMEKAKGEISKLMEQFGEVVKQIPLRKGAAATEQEDRTEETVKKDDIDLDNMRPDNALHALISKHIK